MVFLMAMLEAYPRRSDGGLHLEEYPDHNPLVLQDCSACRGRGKIMRCEADAEGFTMYGDPCAACLQTGITGGVERYFENTREIEVAVDSHGLVRCPGCGKGFTKRSKKFTGLRHRTCGQRIKIISPEGS